jgi:hypothetical protein
MKQAAYADTSLLVSLYLTDANSLAAMETIQTLGLPVILTSWQRFELENACQLRVFRRESTLEDVDRAQCLLADDLAQGAVQEVVFDVPATINRARELTATHTARHGTRAFDVFHVAAALQLHAGYFLSFYARQSALATSVGLKTIARP